MMVQGVISFRPRRNASACTLLTRAPQVLGWGCGTPVEPEVNTTAMRCLLSICGIANASGLARRHDWVSQLRQIHRTAVAISQSKTHPVPGPLIWRSTSGVWVDGSRLTFPATMAAARPTLKTVAIAGTN